MLRIAVDGYNLATDQRGMGRYARSVLDALDTNNDVDLTIVLKNRRDMAPAEHGFQSARFLTLNEAARLPCDATWYPWNGMRFRLRGGSVATIHDTFAFRYPNRNLIARRREQQPIRRAVKEATLLTTVSKFSAQAVATEFGVPLERLTISSPVPDAFWKPVAPANRPPYFLFIAAPDARKNAAMLFRIFARAFPKRDVRLIVAGTLSSTDQRLLAASAIASERVTPTDEQLRELYSGAIALLMPSLAEGYGVPAVEAMACGSAVIASTAGGLPEACDGAALLLPPADEAQWVDAVARLVSDSSLREDLRARSIARAARIDRSLPAKIISERLRQAAEGA
ncbi:MAG: glycosyltransferase family 4 protein [Candidatus Eremiobacteraeota bacterium]|nr:glycosyltransferase family 4 protein [Candidatus Eremiobacteraeota bacterium]